LAGTGQPRRLSLLARIARVGTDPSLAPELSRQIAITNLFSVTTSLTTLPWVMVFLAFERRELALAVLVVSVMCAGSLWLNAGRHFLSSRLWLLFWANTAIFAFALALGPHSGITLLFTATTCAPLALIDPKQHRISFLIALVTPVALGAAAQRYAANHVPLFPLPGRVLSVLFPGLLITTVAMLFFIVSYYYYVYERSRAAREREHRVEQARLDTALRESEQRYALASEGANDGLWEWSAGSGEVFYSERWKAMLGFGPEEIGTSFVEWLDRVHPEDKKRVQADIDAHMVGKSERLYSEQRMRTKDGDFRWMLTRGLAIRDRSGRALRMAGWMTDVTERRLALERVVESEEKSRQLVAQAADAMYFFDLDGRILEVNQRASTDLGYDHGEFQRMYMSDLDAELSRERLTELVANIPQDGGLTLERVHTRKDGRAVPVEMRLGFFRHRDEQHLLASARDISVRKEMEAQLLLADRMASVGTLAAGVAHEVNNPLTSLLLNLEFIERQLMQSPSGTMPPVNELGEPAHEPSFDSRIYEGMRDRVLRAVSRAREGAERVGVIVRDLKTFSRGEAEVRDAVDLRRVVESTLNLAHPELKRRASVQTEMPKDLPAVRANEARLGQVFLNLLLNALQSFASDAPRENRIVIRVQCGESFVLADVIDNGVGIAETVLPRIFDPFFTTKPVGVGTGLGLYICRNIVQSFGGTLSCESELGLGSTFRIRLPTVRSLADGTARFTPVGSVRPTVPPPPDLAPARVLIIDDDASVTATLADILSSHEVMIARAPDEALRALDSHSFDLVLCDLDMHRLAPDRLRPVDLRSPCQWAFTVSAPLEELEPMSDLGGRLIEKPVRSEMLWTLLGAAHEQAARKSRKFAS
jgi:PAS domain S-box-containing protein